MKIALVQMEVLEKNKAGNVQKACELLRQAAPNCDVAVLPEIWTTGYSLGHLSKEADYLNGTVVNELRQIAAENSCAIVAGSIPLRKGDGNVYNTAITIDKNGEIVFVTARCICSACLTSSAFSSRAMILACMSWKVLPARRQSATICASRSCSAT